MCHPARVLGLLIAWIVSIPAWAQPPQPSTPFSFIDEDAVAADPASQPAASEPTPAANQPRNRNRRDRLSRMPKMYGDMLVLGKAAIDDSGFGVDGVRTFPLSGLTKICENNSPVPQDRVFFVQNHFHNAVKADEQTLAGRSVAEANVDRSTFGIEKTFFKQAASIELRLPITFTGDPQTPGPLGTDAAEFSSVGLILKTLLYSDPEQAISCGFAAMIPVGESNVFPTSLGSYILEAETFHLSPFIAGSRQFNDIWFAQGFVQIDFPIDDDDLTATVNGDTFHAGEVAPPTLLHLDGSLGAWLYRDPESSFLTGIASAIELHYTRSISSVDTLSFEDPPPVITLGDFTMGTPGGIELFNLTAGLNFEIYNRTSLRIAAVTPLLDGSRRAFDSEVQFSLNRPF